MCDSEVVDLTLEDGPKPSAGSASQLDLAALAREREARRQSRGDDGGDAKRPRVASTPAAPTGDAPPLRAGTVLGRGGGKKTVLQQRTEKLSLYPEWLRDPKSTRPFRISLQIREQRQRRGCIAQKVAPETQREAPGPSLRDRLRGLVAGPFEGEGRAVAEDSGEC